MNTRNRVYKASEDYAKLSSTIDILGLDNDTYRKWNGFQVSLEIKWSNIENDLIKPISPSDISIQT